MDPAQFFSSSRLVIVAGKGGVGKTTVSAALARAAALTGHSALVVDVDGKSGLPSLFGQEALDYDETVLSPGGGPGGTADVRARALTADVAMLEHLREHGWSRLSRRLASAGVVDVVATAAPGIKDILLLGKVKQIEQSGAADVVVLDAPAAGHAITFLQSARGLLDAVRVGPINAQARSVLDLLEDHRRCQVVLVTLPEETPVNEAVETAYLLEDRVGVALGPVVVNGLHPGDRGPAGEAEVAAAAARAGVELPDGDLAVLAEAARFTRDRVDLQRDQVARLAEQLPLPQIPLPLLLTTAPGPAEVDHLARDLLAGLGELDEVRS